MDVTQGVSLCDSVVLSVGMHRDVVKQSSLKLPRAVDEGKVAHCCSLLCQSCSWL